MTRVDRPSSNGLGSLTGREVPRLHTEPLRPLTPKTSLGFAVIEFALHMLGVPLLPWQRWWFIHALELLPGGGFRFRVILTLVARQNGKTFVLKVLALFFTYMGYARLVLGAAQSLDIAREAWQGALDMAEDDADLRAEVESIRRTNGEQEFRLANGARYKIAAATRSAGRGLSVDLLNLDELREHRSWDAWSALSKTTNARPNALIIAYSNAGDDESVVLNALRDAALAGTDSTLALFEWSAPDGCALDDRDAWAQANPGLGHTISEQAIATSLATDPPAVFRTEVLCQRVDALDNAVDLGAWRDCRDPQATLDDYRDRVVAAVEVAPDGAHVALLAAAVLDDGRVQVEAVAAWGSTAAARAPLAALLDDIAPAATAWFPDSPTAELGALLRGRGDSVPLTGADVAEACMGFAGLVRARQIVHAGDPLLDAHVAGASRLVQGDKWRFARRGGVGHVNAAYAAAGAVHAALTLPKPVKIPKPMVV